MHVSRIVSFYGRLQRESIRSKIIETSLLDIQSRIISQASSRSSNDLLIRKKKMKRLTKIPRSQSTRQVLSLRVTKPIGRPFLRDLYVRDRRSMDLKVWGAREK